MSSLEIPFQNPKARILYYVGVNQANGVGVGTINELSRETGIADVEKTAGYVEELESEKLLAKANLKNDMTILKLTFRGSAMIQTFLPGNKAWYWRVHPIFGIFFLAIGAITLILALPFHDNLLSSIFYALVSLSMGIVYLVIWWWYAVVGRKQFLQLEKQK